MEPRLKGLLWFYRIPVDDAEDIIQDSLMSYVFTSSPVNDPEAWLVGSLKNHCLMYWRKRRRNVYAAVDAALLDWLAQPMQPPQERADLLADLERLIDRLRPRYRNVLRLRFLLGYEPHEVAEKLGYSPASIGKITNRGIAALSRQLFLAGFGPGSDRPGPSRQPHRH